MWVTKRKWLFHKLTFLYFHWTLHTSTNILTSKQTFDNMHLFLKKSDTLESAHISVPRDICIYCVIAREDCICKNESLPGELYAFSFLIALYFGKLYTVRYGIACLWENIPRVCQIHGPIMLCLKAGKGVLLLTGSISKQIVSYFSIQDFWCFQ